MVRTTKTRGGLMAQIKTENLNNLFQGSIYKIPDYQRGYSWQKRQLIDFWDDIQNINENRKHYTGQISIKKIENKSDIISEDLWKYYNGDSIFDVMDGQQRLTTMIIFIQQIVDFAKEELPQENDGEILINPSMTISDIERKFLFDKPRNSVNNTYYFDYYPDNASYNFFHAEIYLDKNIGHYEESFYTHNLLNAKKFFKKNISEVYNDKGLEGLNELFKKLTVSLQFIPYELGEDFDVFVAFETMNNRGKPLSNLEILKNRLIFLSTLFPENTLSKDGKDQLRKKINDAWKDIYQNLGRNNRTVLSDNEFLRAHWIMYYKYSRKKGSDYIDFLLSRKFIVSNIKQEKNADTSEIDDIEELSDEIIDSEENSVNEVNEPLFNSEYLTPDEILKYVDDLQKVSYAWFISFNPYWSGNPLNEDERALIEKINRLGINYFRPLITAAIVKKNTDSKMSLVDFLKNIERWLFISFHLTCQRSNTKSSQYYSLTKDLHFGDIDLYAISNTLKIHTNELFDENGRYRVNRFTEEMRRKFQYNLGYYSWPERHYFFFEYESSIRIQEGEPKIEWSTFVTNENDKVTIEHVLPQTVKADSKWYPVIKKLNDFDRKCLTNSIGNLLALSRSKNSKFSNDCFDDKKNGRTNSEGVELYRGYRHGSHSEIEVSKYGNWTKNEILERSENLIRFMSKHWQLNLSDEQIEELLFVNINKKVT